MERETQNDLRVSCHIATSLDRWFQCHSVSLFGAKVSARKSAPCGLKRMVVTNSSVFSVRINHGEHSRVPSAHPTQSTVPCPHKVSWGRARRRDRWILIHGQSELEPRTWSVSTESRDETDGDCGRGIPGASERAAPS